jgi:uncharacterized membrane protein
MDSNRKLMAWTTFIAAIIAAVAALVSAISPQPEPEVKPDAGVSEAGAGADDTDGGV